MKKKWKLKNKIVLVLLFFLLVGTVATISFGDYQKRNLTILAYHSVMRQADDINGCYSISETVFEQQLAFLKQEGYNVITLSDALAGLDGKKNLPERPLVITFDDGYKDNFYIAMPLLHRYGFPAVIFATTDFIGQDGFLSWEDIKIAKDKGFEFGSHTVSHKQLATLSREDMQREISNSRQLLRENAGVDARFLAYPFGSYNQQTVSLLSEAGYDGACTGITGLNGKEISPYELRRINIPQSDYGVWNFRVRLLYGQLVGWYKHLKTVWLA